MKKSIWVLALAAYAGAVSAISYQDGSGVLSYTYFNLSPNDCTLTPLGGSVWNSGSGSASFFNSPFGGNYNNPESLVTGNYIFYDEENPLPNPGSALTLKIGQPISVTENSQAFGSGQNPASMADEWTVNCSGSSTQTQTVLSTASATNMYASNIAYNTDKSNYPYNVAASGVFENAALNPAANGGCATGSANACGIGATQLNTQGYANYNLNVSTSAPNYAPTGGLWTAVNMGIGAGGTALAVNTLNAAMLPINLAAYVQSSDFISSLGSDLRVYVTQQQVATPIYGGHFTIAIGDPFLVSSYAAKMLWYTVVSPGGVLNDDTTLNQISSNLTNPTGGTPVFDSNQYAYDYVQWLLGSQSSSQNYPGAPQLAANAYSTAFNAASVPVTSESVWGKIFTGLADAALDAGVAALAFVPGGDVVDAAAVGAGTAADGAVTPDMNAAIGNSFTTTTSGPAPLSQTAPVVVNPTYASNNLLGLFLTNYGVQEAINNTMGTTDNPNALWSNYSIYTDNQENATTGCYGISVTNNLFGGYCYPSDSSIPVTNGTGATGSPPAYANVYAGNQTTGQLSVWDAILTGSDVTTNDDGWMVIGNQLSGTAAFSPPVQMWNASAASTLPANLAVNTTFNLNTGYLTSNGYSMPVDPTSSGSTPAPAASPTITAQLGSAPPAGVTFSNLGVYDVEYSSQTGVLTVYGYQANGIRYDFSNGTQTINMTGCPANSSVTLWVYPDAANTANAWGASGSLSCVVNSNLTSASTLAYSACVNDQQATGGVIAAFTTAPNATTGLGGVVELACACIPSYQGGPSSSSASSGQLLGGVVVGATSSNPSQTCPSPFN